MTPSTTSSSSVMFPVLSLLVLQVSLLLLLSPSEGSTATTCNFTVLFPNTTYPLLGELWTGVLSWNDTVDPIIGYPNYGNGYDLLNITGSRTLWSASPAAPTNYTFNSTAAIIGGIPTTNHSFFANGSAGFPVLQFGGILYTNQTFIGGLPNGTQAYFFWDQYIYPAFPNKLDPSGILVLLSTGQFGSVSVPGVGHVVTLSSNDDDPTLPSDLEDDVTLVNYQGYPFDAAGYGGSMTLSNCVGPAGRALGDPQLKGFLSQSFQVHGMDGQVYNLITAPTLQINALFVFLSGGVCPTRNGVKATNCWSHPGSYFGSLSVLTEEGDRLLIVAGGAKEGFQQVELNGRKLTTADTPTTSVSRSQVDFQVVFSSSYTLTIYTDLLTIEVESSDHFLNLLSVTPSSISALARADAHGLLGQTWRQPTIKGSDVPDIEGAVDDYALTSNDMMGSDFPHNRFIQKNTQKVL